MPRSPQNPGRRSPARPCWSGTGHRHAPECRRGLSCRTGRRSDNRLLPSLSRVTPSAASEHFLELLGCPISRSLTACCVCLELRPLPSPGITRFLRYYEPLRHPGAPGLSLTGVRLIIPDHASGFPVLRALPLCTCRRHYPGAADGRTRRSNLPHPYQPSPIPLSRRPAHRPFRGLLGVHSRCGLYTRAVTKFVTAIRGLQTFRHLHACPGCFRLERSPGGPCTHWKSAALSRRTWTADLCARFLSELSDCPFKSPAAARKPDFLET